MERQEPVEGKIHPERLKAYSSLPCHVSFRGIEFWIETFFMDRLICFRTGSVTLPTLSKMLFVYVLTMRINLYLKTAMQRCFGSLVWPALSHSAQRDQLEISELLNITNRST